MIICFLQEQAKIFLTQRTFEVDMSFKRILERNMNEIVFAVWLEEHGKSIVIEYIYVINRLLTNFCSFYACTCYYQYFNKTYL